MDQQEVKVHTMTDWVRIDGSIYLIRMEFIDGGPNVRTYVDTVECGSLVERGDE